MKYRLGIDVGGTFTDFVLVDDDGRAMEAKALSTPDQPAVAMLQGLHQLAEKRGQHLDKLLSECHLILHGTTVALNALIQGTGAKVGLLCTDGFRDTLEIRLGYRQNRYDLRSAPPEALVPRNLRIPVRERINSKGIVVAELVEGDVERAVDIFVRHRVEAVAICFLWSIHNDVHERLAGKIVRERMGDVCISLSADVAPQIREYDRCSTTVVNAYVAPKLIQYVSKTEAFLRQLGYSGEIRYIQSNGGLAAGTVVSTRAVLAVNSGPAAAPAAGVFFSKPLGYETLVIVDMGGTSFDTCLVQAGLPDIRSSADVQGYRISAPMVNVNTVGAGGGSIAWIDNQILRVGPQSAEGNPGPVCYSRGGTQPTVTDADVVLGRLNSSTLLGGAFPIDAVAAYSAIEREIARPLGLSVEEAALGIVEVVTRNMSDAISQITLERGLDPRSFVLVAGGGQGPVHACDLATNLGIPIVVVPRFASTLCAFGTLASDLRHDYSRSFTGLVRDVDYSQLEGVMAAMERTGIEELRQEGVEPEQVALARRLDMRYVGQIYEVSVDVTRLELAAQNHAELEELFHREHERQYTYRNADDTPEIINAGVTAVGKLAAAELVKVPAATNSAALARASERSVWFAGQEQPMNVPVYDGLRLTAGHSVMGPAVVQEPNTTIVVNSDFRLSVAPSGTYVLTRNGELLESA